MAEYDTSNIEVSVRFRILVYNIKWDSIFENNKKKISFSQISV